MSRLQSYQVYIQESRRRAPAIYFVDVADDKRAIEVTQAKLARGSEFVGAEIWQGDRRVAGLGSFENVPAPYGPLGRVPAAFV